MNRSDLQHLATIRLEEARTLFAAGHPSGAYYLAGYAVECAFKAVIARQTQQYDFPDRNRVLESSVHDARKLVMAAKLTDPLRRQNDTDPVFNRYWTVVLNWSEQSRYNVYTVLDAQDMIAAVGDVNQGVLQWIMGYW